MRQLYAAASGAHPAAAMVLKKNKTRYTNSRESASMVKAAEVVGPTPEAIKEEKASQASLRRPEAAREEMRVV